MNGGLRQSNSWLHGWAGLLLGWLMFAIFFTGTIAFFRQEVTVWMQPELHRVTPDADVEAARRGLDRLSSIAPDATKWTVSLPSERNPAMRISWASDESAGTEPRSAVRMEAEETARRANARGGRPQDPGLTLDPGTGEIVDARETAGGTFLYRFHYQLHAMPREWGRWIIGLATFAMFIAIVSGIITHKKIFRDFFTFRGGKGQRSWLDGHNAMAVLSLPFHLMITFSGLLLLGGTLLPWGVSGHGGPGRGGERQEAAAFATAPQKDGWNLPLDQILADAETAWGVPVGRLTIARDGGVEQTAEVSSRRNNSLLLRPGGGPGRTMKFDARSGEMIERSDSLAEDGIIGTDRVMSALHLGRFAPWGLRWLYFVAGVMGTVMVGAGLILWSVKRAEKRRGAPGGFGHRLVDRLNIAAIAGLSLATGAYFWANRLVPAGSTTRVDTEIAVFFAVWAATLLHAMLRPARAAWQEQLAVSGGLFIALPVLNPLTGGLGLFGAIATGNWIVAGFDLIAIAFGASLIFALYQLAKRGARQGAAQPKYRPAPAGLPAE